VTHEPAAQRGTSRSFDVTRQLAGGETVTLAGEQAGQGPTLVLLHGLSATRRNVVQGSRHLTRRGFRLIAYDARGHGDSSPAPDPSAYEYRDLVGDLEAVIANFAIEQPVLVGSSMGAATATAWTLENRRRVQALVQITPAYTGRERDEIPEGAWERLASALEERGVEGFVEVAQPEDIPKRWREAAREATRQRMERHRHPEAVAQALRVVPRSRAFEGLEALEDLEVPTLVVGSRDEGDALHPLEVAEEYARRLPHAELAVEAEGESPLAWHGARLSRKIGDFLESVLAVEH
jgi:pimeloyl-ACP methyl ester carboxylesterase